MAPKFGPNIRLRFDLSVHDNKSFSRGKTPIVLKKHDNRPVYQKMIGAQLF